MFEYGICTECDEEIFKKQCAALERHIPDLIRTVNYTDVDGTQVQKYSKDGSLITVRNDYDVGAVYIESEIELERFFA